MGRFIGQKAAVIKGGLTNVPNLVGTVISETNSKVLLKWWWKGSMYDRPGWQETWVNIKDTDLLIKE